MDPSDSELMSRLAAGESRALDALMGRWADRVTAFLFRMTGRHETAADLAQETFVRLYQSRLSYRGRDASAFSTYLFSIAANLARNHHRWRSRHPELSLESAQDTGAPGNNESAALEDSARNPSEAAQAAEEAARIQAALSRLPEDQREAITLFLLEGLSQAEIARISGCTIKAVENRVRRAREFLREQLGRRD